MVPIVSCTTCMLHLHWLKGAWHGAAISSDLCIRLIWNLTGGCGQQQRLRGWSRMVVKVVKQFQDGGRQPIWKSLYRHQWKIIRFSSNFVHSSRFWTGWLELDERHVIKNEKAALDRLRVRQNVFLVNCNIQLSCTLISFSLCKTFFNPSYTKETVFQWPTTKAAGTDVQGKTSLKTLMTLLYHKINY